MISLNAQVTFYTIRQKLAFQSRNKWWIHLAVFIALPAEVLYSIGITQQPVRQVHK
jgi:hypothetical protein